jgi:type II secretory ATPase GspE/PulE/Tfp pilus assembly ATPase PilB-like protein
MGVPGYLIASTVDTIIAQRLVRLLCTTCKQAYEPEPNVKQLALKAIEKISPAEKANYPNINFAAPIFYKAGGCAACHNIGYLGRIGLYEIMPFTGILKNAVLTGKNTLEIQAIAEQEGMITLEQSGVIRALNGETSLDEVYRVANINF